MKLALLIVCLCLGSLFSYAQRKADKAMIEKFRLTYSPKQSKYKFNKKRASSELLDTNTVYLGAGYYAAEMDGVISWDSSVVFIRFYGGGICFMSMEYRTTPDVSEYDKKDYGKWCMYKIKGSKIIIEYYETQDFPRHFYYNHGMIKGDEIHFYKSHIGRLFTNASIKMNGVVKKVKVPLKDYTINWE